MNKRRSGRNLGDSDGVEDFRGLPLLFVMRRVHWVFHKPIMYADVATCMFHSLLLFGVSFRLVPHTFPYANITRGFVIDSKSSNNPDAVEDPADEYVWFLDPVLILFFLVLVQLVLIDVRVPEGPRNSEAMEEVLDGGRLQVFGHDSLVMYVEAKREAEAEEKGLMDIKSDAGNDNESSVVTDVKYKTEPEVSAAEAAVDESSATSEPENQGSVHMKDDAGTMPETKTDVEEVAGESSTESSYVKPDADVDVDEGRVVNSEDDG